MTYRDELQGALSRIESLDRELTETRELLRRAEARIADLEHQASSPPQSGGRGPTPKPLLEGDLEVFPGRGAGGVVLGRSTLEHVFASFGRDALVIVDYHYDEDGEYRPDRPPNLRRPGTVSLARDVVVKMSFGAYQSPHATARGINGNSTHAQVLDVFGQPDGKNETGSVLDRLRYASQGIELLVDHKSGEVNSFYIFPPRP